MPRTNTPPLGLTRDQLALFLKDHEQIKAFENLFAIVEDIAPDVVQQAIIAAGSAQAGTAQALGALTEIAQSLHLSVKTVSSHKSRIQEKLGLSSTAALVRFGLEHGLGDDDGASAPVPLDGPTP